MKSIKDIAKEVCMETGHPVGGRHQAAIETAMTQVLAAQPCTCSGGISRAVCGAKHPDSPCDCSGGPCPPEVREGWEKYWARVHAGNSTAPPVDGKDNCANYDAERCTECHHCPDFTKVADPEDTLP